MVKATLKSLLAHKLRLALTSLAVVLGVGFVAGSLVLTDTLNATFVRLFKEVDGGVDVRVRSMPSFGEQERGGPGGKYQPVPASLLDEVRRVPGVKGVTGEIQGTAQMLDKAGKPIGGQGPPTLGEAASQDPAISRVTYVRGRAPTSSAEVAIDNATAKQKHFKVGDPIRIVLQGPAQDFRVVGIVKVGSADNLAGATLALFDVDTAHRVLDRPGTFDAIDVKATGGTQTAVRNRIDAALGHRYDVVTGQQLAAEEAADVSNSFVRFLGTALLVFAGVALFVGTFIIANTFSIIVASRTRELALLRALGASRRQVLWSVLAEAALTGLASSVVGVVFGILVAIGLKALFGAFGGELPSSATVLAARTVIVALVVGVLATVLSALTPALRATRVLPIAALREDTSLPSPGIKPVRAAVGVAFAALGLVLLGVGLTGGAAVKVGIGAACFIVGVAALSALVARPLAAAIGAPMARAFRTPGRLARQNAMRNPSRTSSTAAALMIGLALVTFVSVFASSVKSSIDRSFQRSFAADYVLTGKNFSLFTTALADEVRKVPGVASVAALRGGRWRLNGQDNQLEGTELATFANLVKLKLTSGRVPPDNGSGLLVVDSTAKSHHWKVGDTIPMEFAKTGLQEVPIAGVFKRNDLAPKYLLAAPDYERNYTNHDAELVVVKTVPGVPAATSRAALAPVLAGFPNVELKDQVQYKATITSQVNQILALITVLLLLAIVIAVIGIINTLVLSVLERTRELGLLRAVGMSRRQARRMIRWESVIIAVIGAALGLFVGVFFGWALVRALRDQGITVLHVPVGQLVAYLVAAGLFGIVAAVIPARRAARLNVLAAISYE
jgi:putative ABC transport system permease protein